MEVFEGLIKPKITMRVSATPKYIPTRAEAGGYVEAKRSDVVAAGLIKEKIVFQTEEDLEKQAIKKLDQDEMLLELAYAKRLELAGLYKKIGVKVNPLVLIQHKMMFKRAAKPAVRQSKQSCLDISNVRG